MNWRDILGDFTGLTKEVVERLSKHKVADKLNHDRQAIRGWINGTQPSKASDVAWLIRLALQNGIDISSFQAFNPIYDFSSWLSYEERVERLPDLTWLTGISAPPSVSIDFCGIALDSPIGVPSSPLLGDDKWTGVILDLGFGLCTFKTRRTHQKKSWRPPQIAFLLEHPDLKRYDPANPPQVRVTFDRKEVNGSIPNVVNSMGVPSELPAEWQEVYERIKTHHRGRIVGVSVMGDGNTQHELEKDFELAVEKAKEVEPPFIELNLSCPNLEKGTDVCDDLDLIKQICSSARRVLRGTNIPLVIKLPYLPQAKLKDLLKVAGRQVHAVAFRNTIRVRPVIDDREGRFQAAFPDREFGGLSGPCTFEMTRRGLKELVKIKKELHQDFDIIAIGGVSTPSQVVDLLNDGAKVVQACTGPMFDPLLAWKVRFNINQLKQTIQERQQELLTSSDQDIPLLFPRNEVERISFKNADEATKEIRKRFPHKTVSHEAFRDEWNTWMKERPSLLIGQAQRISPARSRNDWIRVFTHAK